MTSDNARHITLHNGVKAQLAFSDREYENRLHRLRGLMAASQVDAVLLTSTGEWEIWAGSPARLVGHRDRPVESAR